MDVLAVFCSEQEYKGCKSYIAVIDSSTVKVTMYIISVKLSYRPFKLKFAFLLTVFLRPGKFLPKDNFPS